MNINLLKINLFNYKIFENYINFNQNKFYFVLLDNKNK